MMFPEQQKVGVPGEDRDEDDDESHVEHEYDRQHHRLHTAGGIITSAANRLIGEVVLIVS